MTPAAYRSRHLHTNPEADTSLQQPLTAAPQLQEAL